MNNIKLYKIFIILITFEIGCRELPVDAVLETERAGILLDGSIEGVRIGDDTLAVIQKLGKPDYFGDVSSNAFIWGYVNDSLDALEISFVKNYPVELIYSVLHVDARVGYKGKTIDSVGIGSNKNLVRSKLGPECVPLNGSLFIDYYKSEETKEGYLSTAFYFYYNGYGDVIQISMRYSN